MTRKSIYVFTDFDYAEEVCVFEHAYHIHLPERNLGEITLNFNQQQYHLSLAKIHRAMQTNVFNVDKKYYTQRMESFFHIAKSIIDNFHQNHTAINELNLVLSWLGTFSYLVNRQIMAKLLQLSNITHFHERNAKKIIKILYAFGFIEVYEFQRDPLIPKKYLGFGITSLGKDFLHHMYGYEFPNGADNMNDRFFMTSFKEQEKNFHNEFLNIFQSWKIVDMENVLTQRPYWLGQSKITNVTSTNGKQLQRVYVTSLMNCDNSISMLNIYFPRFEDIIEQRSEWKQKYTVIDQSASQNTDLQTDRLQKLQPRLSQARLINFLLKKVSHDFYKMDLPVVYQNKDVDYYILLAIPFLLKNDDPVTLEKIFATNRIFEKQFKELYQKNVRFGVICTPHMNEPVINPLSAGYCIDNQMFYVTEQINDTSKRRMMFIRPKYTKGARFDNTQKKDEKDQEQEQQGDDD